MPSRSVDPENPQDLRGAPITLSGTVHATPGCVVLTTTTGRWLLLGQSVKALHDGTVVTVRGRPTALPAACEADRALNVQKVG
jgi:hypothetical protein